jgi:hypothetical protein
MYIPILVGISIPRYLELYDLKQPLSKWRPRSFFKCDQDIFIGDYTKKITRISLKMVS